MSRLDAAAAPVAQPGQRGGKGWLMLTVLLVGEFMALIDALIVNVAVPEIGASLHTSSATLQLVVGGYIVGYAMLLITGARLGDLFGLRRMYLFGVALFTLASLACGLAPTAAVLVVARFAQGVGAAVMVPQIMSVIQMRFTGGARAKAMSAYGVVLALGAVAGLVLGGVLVNANLFGLLWRPVFLVNVPIGLLLLLVVPKVVPADEPRGTRRIDFLGLAVATPAVCLIVLPLVLGHDLGWPAWTFICIVAGLVLAAVFFPLERRIAARGGDPLVNLDVLRAPGMGAGLSTMAVMMLAYGGFLFIFTLHIQAGLGYSALQAGLTYIPMSVTFGLGGLIWHRFPQRFQTVIVPTGMALSGLGYLGLMAAMQSGAQQSPLMWVSLTVTGAGYGLCAAPLMAQSLARVPMIRAADASGVLASVIQLGQVVGVAVFGTVFLSLQKSSTLPHVQASASALGTTTLWIVLLSVVGIAAGLALSRALIRAQRVTSGSAPASGNQDTIPHAA